jgi:hypothetical protein
MVRSAGGFARASRTMAAAFGSAHAASFETRRCATLLRIREFVVN